MRIATYNVNGVNGRLPVLLRWLEESRPDIVCLQELKAPDEKFPATAIREIGYDVVWHGQKSWNGVAILSRVGTIHETQRGLPGDPDDGQSRYLEAAINGIIVAGLYLPNGNPRPGPKFDYKLAWFDRLIERAADLLASGAPVILAGDFNVMPTERDVYNPSGGSTTRCSRPRYERASIASLLKVGPTPCEPSTPTRRFTRSGIISGTPTLATRAFASIIYC